MEIGKEFNVVHMEVAVEGSMNTTIYENFFYCKLDCFSAKMCCLSLLCQCINKNKCSAASMGLCFAGWQCNVNSAFNAKHVN